MTAADQWIWIPNWDGPEGFQHYKTRDPVWIKNYTRLLSHNAYRDLSHHQRGILHSIWMAYATSARQLPGNTLTLTRQLGQRVLTRDLKALSHAGFIEIVASAVLAERLRYARVARTRSQEAEAERELEKSSTVPPVLAQDELDMNGLPISNNFLELQLLHWLRGSGDENTPQVVHALASKLSESNLARIVESTKTARPRDKAAWLVGALKNEGSGA